MKPDKYISEICVMKYVNTDLYINLEQNSNTYFLPSGTVKIHEDGKSTALKILQEKFKKKPEFLRHVAIFDLKDKGDKIWVISNVFYAIVKNNNDLDGFYNINDLSKLNINVKNQQMIDKVIENIKKDLLETKVAKHFLENEFTIPELQSLLLNAYAGKEIKRTHFFTKIKSKNFIEKVLDENQKQKTKMTATSKRPSNLYSFKEEKIISSIYF